MGASVVVLGPTGERTVRADDLFDTYFTTKLEPVDVIQALVVPIAPDGAGHAFVELSRRPGEFAIVNVAAVVELDDDGRCQAVAVACGGVGERILNATDAAMEVLAGSPPTSDAFAEVARRVAQMCRPLDDPQASAEYRRAMAAVYVRRALAAAAHNAINGDRHVA